MTWLMPFTFLSLGRTWHGDATQDIYTPKGNVRPRLIIRKSNTKSKLATRLIPVIEDLRRLLEDLRWLLTEYYPLAGDVYLFPGRSDGHISEDSSARILRGACQQVGIFGVSTHSFRRTALTQMSNAGIPLRVIQEISGHRNLEQLQKYLEVSDEQVLGAAAALSMLSPVGGDVFDLDTEMGLKTPTVKHSISD
ncbi:tyrosine-type recombinase/integrase [Nostoc sp. C110]|uniref:tyrosine-type recombinase/integrase n=1 Tax=Nostoc sp. C110 TaxID=3349876 RepID=UPI00370D05C7